MRKTIYIIGLASTITVFMLLTLHWFSRVDIDDESSYRPDSTTMEEEYGEHTIDTEKKDHESDNHLDLITMKTEFRKYSIDTKRVVVYWINESEEEAVFGEQFSLEKWEDDSWINVGGTVFSYLLGYTVKSHEMRTFTYDFLKNEIHINEGKYRLLATYYVKRDGELEYSDVYAHFNVISE